MDTYLVRELYMFSEVKQNWLGFTLFSNEGQGLGREFAEALHESLASIFADFGEEEVTQGTHIEKLCLIKGGVGRDMVSDFTTNLIKHYLLEYTQEFARRYLPGDRCRNFRVTRAWFNYDTESWVTADYWLPILRSDYVLLTPVNLLTRDETWINKRDMLSNFDFLPGGLFKTRLLILRESTEEIF
jgi:hypothetical protein